MTAPIRTHEFLQEVWSNRVIGTMLLSWCVAQSLKVVLGIFQEKRFNFKWFVETGGMPSSHAASVASLATAVGLSAGFDTALFAVACLMALIIMFDAQGVRRNAGKQAEVLNKILDDIYLHHEIQEDRLKELLGHTPVEVMAGALLGIFITLWCYTF